MKFKYLFVLFLGLGTTLTQVGAQTFDNFADTYNSSGEYNDSATADDYDDEFYDYEEDAELSKDSKTQTLRKIYLNDFSYRWYIQAGVGAQMLMAEDDHKGKLSSRLTIAPSLTAGYRFNKVWGLRMNVTGGSLHGFNDGASGSYRFWKKASQDEKDAMLGLMAEQGFDPTIGIDGTHTWGDYVHTWDPLWTYNYQQTGNYNFGVYSGIDIRPGVNGDGSKTYGYTWLPGNNGNLYMQHIRYFSVNFAVTLNLMNLVNKADDDSKFDLNLFFGPTITHAMKHQYLLAYTGFGFNGGLQAQVHLSDKLGIFAEVNGQALPQGFDGQYGGTYPFDFVGQGILGLTYKFPIAPFTMVSGQVRPEPQVDLGLDELRRALESEIDAIKPLDSEIEELRKMLEALKAKPVEVVKESIFYQKPVHFTIGKSNIDANGMEVIAEVADYLDANPDATVIVTGYADKATGTRAINERLSQERSKNVADALVYEYGIDMSRVAIDWRGDDVQPFFENNLNRAVLFYIEFE